MSRGGLYVGWIPNVAGRLSFSHIGASKFPRPCDRENTGNHLGRRLVVAQTRVLADWLLPNWYFNFLYGYAAQWVFVLVGTTCADPADQIGRVEGELLIFQRKSWEALHEGPDKQLFTPKEIFEGELKTWAREPRINLARDSLPEDALQRLRPLSLFVWSVGIRRSGISWLRLISAACNLAFADDYTGTDRPPNEEDIRYIANQSFFFLKDIGHKHQHHPPGSDTITEVGEIDARNTWLIDTHYRIHRKIVEMRRSRDPKVLYMALGMLSYLSSLRNAAERGRIQTTSTSSQRRSPLTYNNAEIEGSIKSSSEVMKWKQTQLNVIKTALPALALTLVGMSGFENGSIGHALRYVMNDMFQNHPRQTLGIVALFCASSPLYYGVLDLYALPPILHAKRALASTSLRSQAAFWYIGAAFFFTLSFGQLTLASLIAHPSAMALRENPRVFSWMIVAGSAALAALAIYAVPIWSTRRDLRRAITQRLQRVRGFFSRRF